MQAVRHDTSETHLLVMRAASGDPAAHQELCARLAPAIRAFARRRLAQTAAVEDFTQDVLVAFVEALRAGRIEDPSRAASFALGICRNLARERAKVRDRRREATLRFGEEPEPVQPREPVLFDRARLEDCLSMLTGRARRVLLGSYHDDRSDAELATALGMTAANVRVVRHRSLAALRECIETTTVTWVKR